MRRAVASRRKVLPRLLLLLAAAGAAAVAPLPAEWIERWYSRGVYPWLQGHVTPVTNLVPIALFDVAIGIVLLVAVVAFVRRVRAAGWLRALAAGTVGVLTFAAAAYLVFLAVWGLNYRRLPIERRLPYDEARVTREAARRLADDAVQRVNATYAAAHVQPDSGALEAAFAEVQQRLGRERPVAPGVPKRSLLEPYFRWAAIDGMTVPFFLEIILNPDVLAVERPIVLAHEWAHLAGFANEAEANFVAWATCSRGDALSRYSAWLAAYRHASAALPRAERQALAAQLHEGPRRDLAAMAARYARASPVVRHVARETYDAYLRANRVEEGIASYGEVLRLILGSGVERDWQPWSP